jgi:flagellar hook-basal body complex protein FliE
MTDRIDIGRSDINQVLQEMRALKDRAQGSNNNQNINESSAASVLNNISKTNNVEFQSILSSAVDQVNSVQKHSNDLAEAFQLGDPNITLSQVVVASEKASVAFEAMTEVRNRLVSAYEDIMKMPI